MKDKNGNGLILRLLLAAVNEKETAAHANIHHNFQPIFHLI